MGGGSDFQPADESDFTQLGTAFKKANDESGNSFRPIYEHLKEIEYVKYITSTSAVGEVFGDNHKGLPQKTSSSP